MHIARAFGSDDHNSIRSYDATDIEPSAVKVAIIFLFFRFQTSLRA